MRRGVQKIFGKLSAQKYIRHAQILMIALLSLLASNCTNELVFSELVNTRMRMVFKGTYESNAPYDFQTLHNDDGVTTVAGALGGSNLADDIAGLTAHSQLNTYIDIAEVRMATGTSRPLGGLAEDYWEFPARDRVLMCTQTTSNSGRDFNNCGGAGGVQMMTDFFNEGTTLKSSDIKAGIYPHMGIYFRRIVVDPSYQYTRDTGNDRIRRASAFENLAINGEDIEVFYQVPPEGGNQALMFPLERTDLNLQVFGDDDPYVVEIRVFMKNLMMKHIIQEGGISVTLVGPSDWKANHDYNGTAAGRLGGNFIMTARSYKPSAVGSIQVNSSLGAYPTYYAVVPTGQTFDPRAGLPLAATRADQGLITNLPEGQYDLYRTCDQQRCTTAGCTQAGTDGFPETATACTASNPVTVVNGATASVAGCGC